LRYDYSQALTTITLINITQDKKSLIMIRASSTLTILMIGIAIFMTGLSTFTGVAGEASSMMQVFYWYILPPLPFLVLVVLLQIKKDMSVYGLIGSACGAAVAIITPHLLLWIDSMNYSGGGANIGLGLLLIAMPIYIPILMAIGYFFGRLIPSKQNIVVRRRIAGL
jgi:hypothetical protein